MYSCPTLMLLTSAVNSHHLSSDSSMDSGEVDIERESEGVGRRADGEISRWKHVQSVKLCRKIFLCEREL